MSTPFRVIIGILYRPSTSRHIPILLILPESRVFRADPRRIVPETGAARALGASPKPSLRQRETEQAGTATRKCLPQRFLGAITTANPAPSFCPGRAE